MAKKAKPAADTELEDLDKELAELGDEADAAGADDSEPDDDAAEPDTTDEAPVKKGKKGKKAKAAAVTDGPIGTKDLAAALGTDGRNLRVMLRDKGANAKKDEETGRYQWSSLEDALVALGFKNEDEAKAALKEARDKRLNKLKEDAAAKRGDEGGGKKKKKKNKS